MTSFPALFPRTLKEENLDQALPLTAQLSSAAPRLPGDTGRGSPDPRHVSSGSLAVSVVKEHISAQCRRQMEQTNKAREPHSSLLKAPPPLMAIFEVARLI